MHQNYVRLSDADICSLCFLKKSPFLDYPAKSMELAFFESHLRWREENEELLKQFNCTRKVDIGYKSFLFDEDHRAFIICPSQGSYKKYKPDVFMGSDVISVKKKYIKSEDVEIGYISKNYEYKSYWPSVNSVKYTFALDFKIKNDYTPLFRVDLNNNDPVFIDRPDCDLTLEDSIFEGLSVRTKYLGRRDNSLEVMDTSGFYDYDKRLSLVCKLIKRLQTGRKFPKEKKIPEYRYRLISPAAACKCSFLGFLGSVISAFCCCGFLCPVSFIISFVGLIITRKKDYRGKVYAVLGMLCSMIQLVLMIVYYN